MGRRSETGGVTAKGDRIQIRFPYRGQDLRPTLGLKPNAANLKHAKRLRETIMAEIQAGTFSLRRYFPDYRLIEKHQKSPDVATFAEVRDAFIKWVGTRQEHSSVLSLRRKLTSFWTPRLGGQDIRKITFKTLSEIVSDYQWGAPKTHNNYVSALREMFAYALKHEFIDTNPAAKLEMLKVQRPDPNPYTVQEALALIAAAHRTHGEIDGHYWHLAFLLGMRPGEQISVQWSDWNRITGKLSVRRMRTEGQSKESTKTHHARHMDLPPRAVEVLNALRPLTSMRGEFVFIDHLTGEQIKTSTVMQQRWATLHKLAGVSYREPYQCRHSSVSWKIMAGENLMKISKNHGHSMATMLKTYAHWVESDNEEQELARIMDFYGFRTASGSTQAGESLSA
jgi:integrase